MTELFDWMLDVVGMEAVWLDRDLMRNVVYGDRIISEEYAAKLGRRFNNSPEFWINLKNIFNESRPLDAKNMKSKLKLDYINRIFR